MKNSWLFSKINSLLLFNIMKICGKAESFKMLSMNVKPSKNLRSIIPKANLAAFYSQVDYRIQSKPIS